ncbi:hypothetical protein LLB_0289 [Legionella longbeachae D-4968]|nr:hypothetical protein LLB_0289 [Legionella longbeachae D-4968]
MKNLIKCYFANILVLDKIQNDNFDKNHGALFYTQRSVVAIPAYSK